MVRFKLHKQRARASTTSLRNSHQPRPSSYPLLGLKYPLLRTLYPQLRVQGGSWNEYLWWLVGWLHHQQSAMLPPSRRTLTNACPQKSILSMTLCMAKKKAYTTELVTIMDSLLVRRRSAELDYPDALRCKSDSCSYRSVHTAKGTEESETSRERARSESLT